MLVRMPDHTPIWLERLADALADEVVGTARLSGGDVADAFRVTLASGRHVFAKTHRRPPPSFFTTEAVGLEWLRDAGAVDVPRVLSYGDDPDGPYLALEWIDVGAGPRGDDADLGRRLARLHRAGAPSYGRADRRPTGSRSLPNDPCDTWVEFFAERRLRPLIRLAADEGALPSPVLDRIEEIAARLEEIGGPPEQPARLHGDLWAGNRVVDTAGRSWLIDPAAHGGHREFELAMMQLFGGFGRDVFAAYDDEHPLAAGWIDRVPLHQLAPLMVHTVKFGGGYVGATARAVDAVRSI